METGRLGKSRRCAIAERGEDSGYKSFVEDCRELSPRALARLREALELPWTKQTARTILTAAALVIEEDTAAP